MVVTYSLKKDGNKQITQNFKVKEFACNGYDEVKIDTNLVQILQKIRTHFGKSVTVTSAYRPEAYNKTIKTASKTSKHILGRAADIKISGVSPITVALYAQSIGAKGVGLYVYLDEDMQGFVHIDTRASDTDKSIYRGLYTNRSQSQYVSCGSKFFPVLKNGSTGYVVRLLQKLLILQGYNLKVDGLFGNGTLTALKAFQRSCVPPADGSVGTQTWTMLLKKNNLWY